MKRSYPSFGRRWALPILLGAVGGLACVCLLMDALTASQGDLAAGIVSSWLGIGIGFGMTITTCLLGQQLGRLQLATLGSPTSGS